MEIELFDQIQRWLNSQENQSRSTRYPGRLYVSMYIFKYFVRDLGGKSSAPYGSRVANMLSSTK